MSNLAVAYALRGGDLITVLFMAETYKKFKVSNNNLKKDADKFKKQKKVCYFGWDGVLNK